MAAPPTLSGGAAGKNKNVRAACARRAAHAAGADRARWCPQARLPPEVNRILYIRCACALRCAPRRAPGA